MEEKLYAIDGIYWLVDKYNDIAVPICPKDKVEFIYNGSDYDFLNNAMRIDELQCEECKTIYKFKRSLHDEMKYVVRKVEALDRKDYKIIDIDGILTPVTKKEKIGENGYFCTYQVRDSKRGPQVVIYAGKKGSGKSQIFITPDERRLSFDQNDINPVDVFARITAEFRDGTKHTIEKGKENE